MILNNKIKKSLEHLIGNRNKLTDDNSFASLFLGKTGTHNVPAGKEIGKGKCCNVFVGTHCNVFVGTHCNAFVGRHCNVFVGRHCNLKFLVSLSFSESIVLFIFIIYK